jgi:hypothetical protein
LHRHGELAGGAARELLKGLPENPAMISPSECDHSTGLGPPDQRPEILLHLEAVRAEETDSSAQLPGLARLVDREH